jgi:hypothetical protein
MMSDMLETLNYPEIQQRYEGEWVLIAYDSLDENLKPISGKVIAHSTDRDEVYAALGNRGSQGVSIECFVKIPEDMAFIL